MRIFVYFKRTTNVYERLFCFNHLMKRTLKKMSTKKTFEWEHPFLCMQPGTFVVAPLGRHTTFSAVRLGLC